MEVFRVFDVERDELVDGVFFDADQARDSARLYADLHADAGKVEVVAFAEEDTLFEHPRRIAFVTEHDPG